MAIESRCGILCDGCQYRETMHCAGCTHISEPFWGKCALKECCEAKGLEYCGACAQFPCALLIRFAWDAQEGDGGRRIEQCRCWQRNG